MSIPWINAAMEDRRSKNGARLMLFVLADRANNHGVSYYGIETLMRRSNLGKSAAHSAIRDLIKLELLRVDYKKGLKGCNVYHLLLTVRNLDGAESAPCEIQHATVQNPHSDRAESGPNPSRNRQEPSLIKKKGRSSLDECRAWARELGLPESDGDSFFAVKEENGWMNGPNKTRDAKATFLNWHRCGFHPSQKAIQRNGHAAPAPIKSLPSSKDLYPSIA